MLGMLQEALQFHGKEDVAEVAATFLERIGAISGIADRERYCLARLEMSLGVPYRNVIP